jgi:multiple sugar transport system substrate-binding protein
LAVALGSLLGGTVAACGDEGGGGGGDEQVTLRFEWWGNADRAKLTQQAVDLFMQKNPNIKIETSFAEFNAYFQKLATQVGGGGGPDVLQMDYRYVREYADRNALLELDADPAKPDTSQINPALLNGGKVNGKLYAIPLGQNTQVFSWDPAQWKSVGATDPKDGWTWTDLRTAAQKVSDGTAGKVKGVVNFGPIEDWFEVWLRQQGKKLYTDDGKLGYTAAEVQAYWEFAESFRKSGAATTAEQTAKMDGSQANDPMTQKLASSGFGYDGGFTPQTWEIMGRETKVAPFPTDTGTLGQYAKPSMLVSIGKRSKHPAEAAKFISWFINDPEAGKILGLSRGMPVNPAIRDAVGATLTGPPKMGYEFETAIAAKLTDAPPPPPKGAGAVKSAFQRVYDDVMFERSTPAAAAQKFMTEAQQALTS